MHKPESVLENKTHKILLDFEIEKDNPILAKSSDLMLINKKKDCHLVDFAVPADNRGKMKESKKINKYLDLARELKKLGNMKVTMIPIVVGMLGKETWRIGNQKKNWRHTDHSTVKLN